MKKIHVFVVLAIFLLSACNSSGAGSSCDYKTYEEKLRPLFNDFIAAYGDPYSIKQADLESAITNLQSNRVAMKAITPPKCLTATHMYFISGLGSAIAGLQHRKEGATDISTWDHAFLANMLTFHKNVYRVDQTWRGFNGAWVPPSK